MNGDSDDSRSRAVRPKQRVDQICERFESAWVGGEQPRLEDFLGDAPTLHLDLLKQLLLAEWDLLREAGQVTDVEAYANRFTADARLVRQTFSEWESSRPHAYGRRPHAYGRRQHRSEQSTNAGRDLEASTVAPQRCLNPSVDSELPESIGRYHVERLLGEGGFGRVYLARDTELDRPVAVKVPKLPLRLHAQEIEAYRKEARIVARLDHPNIVPVHDSGSTDQFPVFIVSKFIEGTDLASQLKENRLDYATSAKIIATVADSLEYAHQQGLVHRDIKPGNILLDLSSQPFLVDFGLALHEQDLGEGTGYAGTPAYMSPEQARGEGHRVDGRSDIFSLSIVLYELLTKRRPWNATVICN